ncbi:MAG: SET domain-containing protein [Verrucomicrobiales bacterium]
MSSRTANFSGVYCGPASVGRGIFAGQRFEAGSVVFALEGELMSLQEILRKGDAAANAFQMDRDLYLYPVTLEGRFVNHSCAPNAGLREDHQMIALRDIEPGDEIRFDYSTCMSEQFWTMDCYCGERGCRGVITDFHELQPSLQAHYLSLGVVQRFIIREIMDRSGQPVDTDVPLERISPLTLRPRPLSNTLGRPVPHVA